MTQRFTEQLRELSQPTWSQAVQHRFVRELYQGEVADTVMATYLIQDYRFLDSFLTLIGSAIASADSTLARLRFGRFAGMVSSDENTYFLRGFDALGISEQQRTTLPDSAPTAGFKAIMLEAAATRSYAAILSVLNVAEWLYRDWATRAPRPLPENFLYAERDRCEDFFLRAVTLEKAFFDAAYD